MTFMAEAFLSGCISKVINDGKDYSWTKIKSVINNKNDRNLSTRIYRVIERTLNIVTDRKFENTDKLYSAIERIFIVFRDNGSTIESVKCGLSMLSLDVSEQRCEDFLEKFYEGICQDDNLYKTVNMILQHKGIKISQEEFQKLNKKIDNLTEIVSIRNDNEIGLSKREPVKSRTQEYADKWEANMFLNDFDNRDKKAGTNVKLSEVYLEEHLPHYIWEDNDEEDPSTDLKELLSEYIYEKKDNKMLLVLGQPGIGKSTLIIWITVNFADRTNDILVYRFASDLGNVDWNNGRISNRVLEELGLNHSNLSGKILILDGFDEVSIEPNRRKDILDSLYGDWIYNKTIDNFSLIITCRENYVPQFAILKCKYITLQPWDKMQIKSFCNIFQEKAKNSVSEDTVEKLLKNKEILGIPLILYMVLALNISIEKEGSMVDVYDKIFSLEGGIYDRCIDNKMFADKHRIGDVKKCMHQISREIAIWIFENNPEDANIPQDEYMRICDDVVRKVVSKKDTIKNDFLISNYYKLVKHCEGVKTERLYFVHRSIYEYFVTETIFNSIENAMLDLSDESQETFISSVDNYLKTGQLENTLGEFLKYKILKLYYKMNIDKKETLWKWWEVLIEKMMKRGMLYHVNGNMRRFDYMAIHEAICFYNIMYVLSQISEIYPQNVYILSTIEKGLLQIYVRLYSKIDEFSMIQGINGIRSCPLTIRKTIFTGKMYQGLYLAGADFSESNFTDQDLSKSILSSSNFDNAIMINTNLQKANLENASMKGTDLRGADLRNANLDDAKIKGINLDGAKIEDSIWKDEDILEIRPLMRKAIFNYIKLQHIHGQERIDREKLFSL